MPSPLLPPAVIRIATRGSALALAQTTMVEAALRAALPELRTERLVIQTSGDRFTDRPLAEIGGKALFTREIDSALLAHEADIAVHSLKDVPSDIPDALMLAATLPREDARDVLFVGNRQLADVMELPQGCVVATSSPRRAMQVQLLRPDVHITTIRGNVPTRIEKAAKGDVQATLLAAAGMNRLRIPVQAMLSVAQMVPAIGQGIVAIACRTEDAAIQAALAAISHAPTFTAMRAERAMLAAMEGTCHSPIAGYASWQGEDSLVLEGFVCSTDRTRVARHSLSGPATSPEALGERMAETLLREVPRGSYQ